MSQNLILCICDCLFILHKDFLVVVLLFRALTMDYMMEGGGLGNHLYLQYAE